MKISIITIVHEGEEHINDAIISVITQSYSNYEYIIIDNDSKDKTLDIIQQYHPQIHKVLSEPDKGIYDALNKGIAMATGDVIGFLHSDDFYAGTEVIQTIADAFDENTDAVYADLDYVSRIDKHKIIRRWRSGEYTERSFYRGWMPPHPTFFVRKCIYERYGGYQTKLRSAADYELMLRFILKHKISLKYIPKVLVKMRTGGQSNRSLRNRIKAHLEDRIAWRINRLTPKWYTLLLKPIQKIPQYFL